MYGTVYQLYQPCPVRASFTSAQLSNATIVPTTTVPNFQAGVPGQAVPVARPLDLVLHDLGAWTPNRVDANDVLVQPANDTAAGAPGA